MATSGTWAFTLDLPQIIEQAYERVGSEFRSGWDYHTARISLDLLLLEWQNRGLNLWTVKNASETLTAGANSFTLSAEKEEVIEASLRTGAGTTDQVDLTMQRVSVSSYAHQTNKLSQGRPIQFFVQRAPEALTIFLWPVPDASATYVFNYWYLERVEDTGKDGTNTVDVPARYLPALVAGLAFQICLKTPKAFEALPVLEKEYERQWELASDASRERASVRLLPARNY